MFLQKNRMRAALAAPSWVFPGSIAENCAFLAGKVDEVGLLFLESSPALGYGPAELPPALADLPLSWHAHLPVDLDWSAPAAAAASCLALMSRVDFLGAKKAVLHPPQAAGEEAAFFLSRLQDFMLYWRHSGRASRDLLLENLPEHRPDDIMEAAERLDASICLDLAHYLLSGGAGEGLPEAFMERVRLLHLSAPAPTAEPDGRRGRHHPLTALDETGRAAGAEICRAARPDTVFMLELFDWSDFTNSLPLLRAWME